MFRWFFSKIGLMRPDPRKKPPAHGLISITPRVGVQSKAYFKALRKFLPYLSRAEEKMLKAHYKDLRPGGSGTIQLIVGRQIYEANHQAKRYPFRINMGDSIRCGGCFTRGCCDGPQVGSRENLANDYYIAQYLGEEDWPWEEGEDY